MANPYKLKPEHRTAIGDAEWALRCELAASFQLADMYGLSDMHSTHFSARVPGPEHHFLLNPFGTFFDEITASSLIKVDLDGNLVGEGDDSLINRTGFVVHSAIHMHAPELICVMHTHAPAITSVAMQDDGLLPLSQKALLIWGLLKYHDYEGLALDPDERTRIQRDLGTDGRVVILRNHGGLTVGKSVAEAFCWMYRLDSACKFQIGALSGNRKLRWLQPETVEHTAAQAKQSLGPGGFAECGKIEWPALLRKLERERGKSYLT